MLFDPKHDEQLDALEAQLRRAASLTPDLIFNVIAGACTRLPLIKRAVKATRIDQLIEARAWGEATLALIELELRRGSFVASSMRTANGSALSQGSLIRLRRSMTLPMLSTKYCLWRS